MNHIPEPRNSMTPTPSAPPTDHDITTAPIPAQHLPSSKARRQKAIRRTGVVHPVGGHNGCFRQVAPTAACSRQSDSNHHGAS